MYLIWFSKSVFLIYELFLECLYIVSKMVGVGNLKSVMCRCLSKSVQIVPDCYDYKRSEVLALFMYKRNHHKINNR